MVQEAFGVRDSTVVESKGLEDQHFEETVTHSVSCWVLVVLATEVAVAAGLPVRPQEPTDRLGTWPGSLVKLDCSSMDSDWFGMVPEGEEVGSLQKDCLLHHHQGVAAPLQDSDSLQDSREKHRLVSDHCY